MAGRLSGASTRTGLCRVASQHELITAERLSEIKHAGFFVFVYTVNDPDRAKYLADLGVDAICTDEVVLIKPF